MERTTWALSALLAICSGGCLAFQTTPLQHAPGDPGIYDFATIDGVRLHLRDSGGDTREAVLLIHGYASGISEWAANFDALAAARRVVAVDLKGFGESDKPAGDYSPAAQAQLLIRLMDELGIERAHLVAHSWGTSVALALALEHSARVGRVVLVCPWVYEEQLPTFFHLSRLPGVGETLYFLYYREQADNRAADGFYDHGMVTEELVDKIKAAYQRPGAVAAAHATARDMVFSEMEQRYQSIASPTLLISGRADGTSGVEIAERLEAQLPDAHLEVFERSAHFPHLEQAAAFNRLVLGFLAADRSAQAGAAERAPAAVASPATTTAPQGDPADEAPATRDAAEEVAP